MNYANKVSISVYGICPKCKEKSMIITSDIYDFYREDDGRYNIDIMCNKCKKYFNVIL